MNGYELTRKWFNWVYENPDKVRPTHTAVYLWAVELCNRMGWKEKFGIPAMDAMEHVGIKSKDTYYKAFNDLVDWGFVKIVQRSKNGNSANIISLVTDPKIRSVNGPVNELPTQKLGQYPDSNYGGNYGGNRTIDKHNKPIKLLKKENEGNMRALEFLKINCQSRFEQEFQMRYGNKIRDKKKFTQDFNDKVDIEGLEFTDRILFARLNTFSRNWIENQEKYARPEENKQTSGIPIG